MELSSLVFALIFLAGAADRKLHSISAPGSVPESITKGLLYVFIAAILIVLLIGLNRIKPKRRRKKK